MNVRNLRPEEELELAMEVLQFLEGKFEKTQSFIRKQAVLELALKAAEAYDGKYIVGKTPKFTKQ